MIQKKEFFELNKIREIDSIFSELVKQDEKFAKKIEEKTGSIKDLCNIVDKEKIEKLLAFMKKKGYINSTEIKERDILWCKSDLIPNRLFSAMIEK